MVEPIAMTTPATTRPERLRLQLDPSPRPASEPEPFLEAASRALAEAQANLDHPSLKHGCRMTRKDVRELLSALSAEAWNAASLDGEAPIEDLHEESSGWTSPDERLAKTPWLLLAIDALDFVATAMREGDTLVLETPP